MSEASFQSLLSMSSGSPDLFGKAAMPFYRGERKPPVVMRGDGRRDIQSLEVYFQDYDYLGDVEERALGWVKGRVLDVACGPGRHLLWLQQKRYEATGIDISPPSIEVARLRECRNCMFMDICPRFPPNSFDTVLMMGDNFGVPGG